MCTIEEYVWNGLPLTGLAIIHKIVVIHSQIRKA